MGTDMSHLGETAGLPGKTAAFAADEIRWNPKYAINVTMRQKTSLFIAFLNSSRRPRSIRYVKLRAIPVSC